MRIGLLRVISCKACLIRPRLYWRPPDVRPGAAHGATTFGRRVPRDDLVPRLPDRRIPPATGTPTLASRVAEMLGVSRASAGEMLKRLEAEGLVHRGEHKEALLTPSGGAGREGRPPAPHHRAAADRLHGLHGRRGARPRRRARRDLQRRDDRADRREARPPGPLPARLAGGHRLRAGRERELAPLAALEPGGSATIVRLAEHDGELLHWFYDQGSSRGRRSRCGTRSRRPGSSPSG